MCKLKRILKTARTNRLFGKYVNLTETAAKKNKTFSAHDITF